MKLAHGGNRVETHRNSGVVRIMAPQKDLLPRPLVLANKRAPVRVCCRIKTYKENRNRHFGCNKLSNLRYFVGATGQHPEPSIPLPIPPITYFIGVRTSFAFGFPNQHLPFAETATKRPPRNFPLATANGLCFCLVLRPSFAYLALWENTH